MNKKRILIIDADTDHVEILCYILREYNYTVWTSATSLSLAEIAVVNPDLIILDDWLTPVRGRELCGFLKANEPTKHIPVLMLSAIDGLTKTALACGADLHVAKPYDLEEVIAAVRSALK